MRYALALFAALLAACTSSGYSAPTDPETFYAQATQAAANGNAQAAGYAAQGRAIERQRANAAATTQAARMQQAATQWAMDVTATALAQPTATPEPTAIPTATPTVAPTATPTVAPSATSEPSRAVVVVEVTAQPTATTIPNAQRDFVDSPFTAIAGLLLIAAGIAMGLNYVRTAKRP